MWFCTSCKYDGGDTVLGVTVVPALSLMTWSSSEPVSGVAVGVGAGVTTGAVAVGAVPAEADSCATWSSKLGCAMI